MDITFTTTVIIIVCNCSQVSQKVFNRAFISQNVEILVQTKYLLSRQNMQVVQAYKGLFFPFDKMGLSIINRIFWGSTENEGGHE